MPHDELDDLLTLPFSVAWASEGKTEFAKLGWWTLSSVDEYDTVIEHMVTEQSLPQANSVLVMGGDGDSERVTPAVSDKPPSWSGSISQHLSFTLCRKVRELLIRDGVGVVERRR